MRGGVLFLFNRVTLNYAIGGRVFAVAIFRFFFFFARRLRELMKRRNDGRLSRKRRADVLHLFRAMLQSVIAERLYCWKLELWKKELRDLQKKSDDNETKLNES